MVGGEAPESPLSCRPVLEATPDAFQIAEEDSAIRASGDFLRTRQFGIPPCRVADIVRDTEFLRLPREVASDFPGVTGPRGRTKGRGSSPTSGRPGASCSGSRPAGK